MWKCNCGTENQDEANFCSVCGAKKVATSTNDQSNQTAGGTNQTNGQEIGWYYVVGNVRTGPITLEQMKGLINQGIVVASTSVWNQSMLSWMPANTTILSQSFQGVPPVISHTLSNGFAWGMALIPLLILIPYGWIFGIILNCVFAALDIDMLKKNGQASEQWMYVGYILAPVYLFLRASKLKQSYGYAILWCALFVVICILLLLAVVIGVALLN